ncbi:MAG: hypothetical protein EG826_15590 [Deltaproteobacteria bacterium]|nr:hypothetical protein [Deltaproteobacteria bacterium]
MKNAIVWYRKSVVAGGAAAAAGSTFAAGVDLSPLTGAVDLSTVIAGVVAVGALLLSPQIAKYAVSSIRRMFPR